VVEFQYVPLPPPQPLLLLAEELLSSTTSVNSQVDCHSFETDFRIEEVTLR
jgi:hypothetical protein